MAGVSASSGWDLGGATFLASIITGVGSTFGYYALAMSSYGPLFDGAASVLLMLGIGFGVGMLIVWPICLIFAAIGVSLAQRHKVVRRWSIWMGTGFSAGAFILLPLPLLNGDFTPETLVAVALLGGLPGAFASGLTYKLLGVAE